MSLAWMYCCNIAGRGVGNEGMNPNPIIYIRSRVLCNNSLKRTCHRCSFDLHYTYSLCWSDHGVDCLVGPLLAPSLLVTGALRTSLMVVGFVSRHCWYCCPCGVSEPFTVPTLVRGYTYNHMESTKKLIKIKKIYAGTLGKIIPIETNQTNRSLCDRVSHSSWWLEPPTGNWKVMGSISGQFVIYTAVFDMYFRFITWFVF